MIISSDLSPRLRFALEFAVVVALVLLLTGIAMRQFVHLMDRVIVSEAPMMSHGEVLRQTTEYMLWGRYEADQEPAQGQYVSSTSVDFNAGLWTVRFSDDAGSRHLRGREVVWRLVQDDPWSSPVFAWSCLPEGPDGSRVAQASLPNYCKE